MQLNLKKPVAFFDLETTGTNIPVDRIIEIAIIKLFPNGEKQELHQFLNPTVKIPLESSLIHGIYDEDVKDKPTFKSEAKNFAKFLEGCDLAGFNSTKFDVPILVEEFLRAGVEFDVSERRLLDAQKIFHLMEKRNLTAAYSFYCKKNLENAHSAAADTQATMEVFIAQIAKYEGQKAYDGLGKEIGVIENDMESIHQLTNEKMVDLAGRFVFDTKGTEIFNFGKHKGKSVVQVLSEEPSYYDWMMKGDFPLDTKRKLTQIKLKNAFLK